jgi:hypothetical protein
METLAIGADLWFAWSQLEIFAILDSASAVSEGYQLTIVGF